MTYDDQRLLAIVRVRCRLCLQRGRSTAMGEMVLVPGSGGPRWAWIKVQRACATPDPFGPRETRRVGHLAYGGGIQRSCDRCSHAPRVRVQTLAREAERVCTSGVAPQVMFV